MMFVVGLTTVRNPVISGDVLPVFHYKSAPLKRRPPANIYREEISPGDFILVKCLPRRHFTR